jgi:hypothetical protein
MLDAPKLRTAIALWADDLGLDLSNLDGDMLIDRIRAALVAAPPADRSTEPEFETAPDNGTPHEVLAYLLDCAKRWVLEARIIGNARAGDIERALEATLTPPAETVVDVETIKARAAAVICEVGALCGWPGPDCKSREAADALYDAGLLAAALATQPAVKDDETVVEALPLREIRRRVRNIWGAISSNQVIDKDVEGQAKRLLADIDAALAAKDGRS